MFVRNINKTTEDYACTIYDMVKMVDDIKTGIDIHDNKTSIEKELRKNNIHMKTEIANSGYNVYINTMFEDSANNETILNLYFRVIIRKNNFILLGIVYTPEGKQEKSFITITSDVDTLIYHLWLSIAYKLHDEKMISYALTFSH